jgi:hypothetical protein
MLATGSEVFLQVGEGADGRMFTARVVAWTESLVTAAFTDLELNVAAGQTAWLCYDWDGQFLRRAVRVDAVMDGEDRRTVGLQLVSDANPADRRESARISTAIVGLSVEVNGEVGCPLLDVSANGFAVVASVALEVGQTADVSLIHAAKRFHGQVRVRSATEITPGQYRYGMYCLVHRSAGGDLAEGLRRVRDAVMRRSSHRTSA